VQLLVDSVQAEYTSIYGNGDETPFAADEFRAPHGDFYLAYDRESPLAMGGWRFRPDVIALGGSRAAEIKRMYVAPSRRGSGLAASVLAHLESTARDAGADLMILETGRPQRAAVAFYAKSGYRDAGVQFGFYAGHEHSMYLAKRL
jgi:GNAT superfamily N-acetyltransferase